MLTEADPTSWGGGVAAIIVASGGFLAALAAFISSVRNSKKAASIEAKVTRSDEKLDVVTGDVKLVVQHTNSMKDDLLLATKDLATAREKERSAAESRAVQDANAKALANGIAAEEKGRAAGREAGRQEERDRHRDERDRPPKGAK